MSHSETAPLLNQSPRNGERSISAGAIEPQRENAKRTLDEVLISLGPWIAILGTLVPAVLELLATIFKKVEDCYPSCFIENNSPCLIYGNCSLEQCEEYKDESTESRLRIAQAVVVIVVAVVTMILAEFQSRAEKKATNSRMVEAETIATSDVEPSPETTHEEITQLFDAMRERRQMLNSVRYALGTTVIATQQYCGFADSGSGTTLRWLRTGTTSFGTRLRDQLLADKKKGKAYEDFIKFIGDDVVIPAASPIGTANLNVNANAGAVAISASAFTQSDLDDDNDEKLRRRLVRDVRAVLPQIGSTDVAAQRYCVPPYKGDGAALLWFRTGAGNFGRRLREGLILNARDTQGNFAPAVQAFINYVDNAHANEH